MSDVKEVTENILQFSVVFNCTVTEAQNLADAATALSELIGEAVREALFIE